MISRLSCRKNRLDDLPDNITHCNDGRFVLDVDLVRGLELDKDTGLVPLAAKHNRTHDSKSHAPFRRHPCFESENLLGTAHNDVLDGSRNCFLSRCMYEHIIFPANSAQRY